MKVPQHIRKIDQYEISDSASLSYSKKERFLKLDWNESTYPPAPNVSSEVKKFLDEYDLSYYPDVSYKKLKNKLTSYTKASKDCIEVFNGSDAAIKCIVRTFMSNGDNMVVKSPVYTQPFVFVQSCGAQVKSFTTSTPFDDSIEKYHEKIDSKTAVVYIPNPCNPTGVLLSREKIRSLLSNHSNTLFVIDEAYYEFTGETVIPLIKSFPNLVVTRTFSKAFALAGGRIGYVIGDSSTLRHIRKIHNPKSVNTLGQIAASAALNNVEYYRKKVEQVESAKVFVSDKLSKMNVKHRVCNGNFFLIKTAAKDNLIKNLKKENILVRDRGYLPQLNGYIRVTIARKQRMSKFMEVLRKVI
ncbi:histidinol-phosphate transaminase [Salinibacter ruber]|uniref:histidinol-phosphate transaminase n=1 Tax=Salinibacter ruber TaxID=146919 RepID=UPI002167E2D2|nr:histidinol-phosphate transaminase [Salinibacter ruber]MCS4150733.1 histidinol-phosphate aminotransferase [Salinibacter ruber]